MPDRAEKAQKATREQIKVREQIGKHVQPKPDQVMDEQVARARATPWTWGKGNKVP